MKKTKKVDVDIEDIAVGDQDDGEMMEIDQTAVEQVAPDDEYEDQPTEFDEIIEEEGQLSVDVYQDRNSVIIKSTIAGVEPEDIDISIDNDMITIRGRRQRDETTREEDYFYQECYWGSFSRSIILPVEIMPDQVDATIHNGILTVILPKAHKKNINIRVKDEN